MAQLQHEHGVEFALVYLTGPGKNGGGGKYILIRGVEDSVQIPLGSNVRVIYHTHPTEFNGETVPLRSSAGDKKAMQQLKDAGSPQRKSVIVTEDGKTITFTATETIR